MSSTRSLFWRKSSQCSVSGTSHSAGNASVACMKEATHLIRAACATAGLQLCQAEWLVAAACGHRFIVMADRLLLVPVTLDQFFDADFLDNESAFVFPTVASFVLNALTGCAASMPV